MALVIAYRNHDLVRDVLTQLSAQTLPPRQVIIADNGGTLGEADLTAMPLPDRTVLVSLPENPGYGLSLIHI